MHRHTANAGTSDNAVRRRFVHGRAQEFKVDFPSINVICRHFRGSKFLIGISGVAAGKIRPVAALPAGTHR